MFGWKTLLSVYKRPERRDSPYYSVCKNVLFSLCCGLFIPWTSCFPLTPSSEFPSRNTKHYFTSQPFYTSFHSFDFKQFINFPSGLYKPCNHNKIMIINQNLGAKIYLYYCICAWLYGFFYRARTPITHIRRGRSLNPVTPASLIPRSSLEPLGIPWTASIFTWLKIP